MKFNGNYKFQSSKEKIFDALLNPEMLKGSIPGCVDSWWPDEHHMKVRIETPVPGLEGPYDITIRVKESQKPDHMVLSIGRSGRIGGTIDIVAALDLAQETDGTQLAYDANAEMSGPVAAANNPIFVGMAKQSLKTFFKNLDKRLSK